MGNFLLKLQWVRRLLFAGSYIVVADGSSVIVIRGVNDPVSFQDVLQIQTQHASLVEFRQMLDDLIHEHEAKVKKLIEGGAGGSKNTTN